MKRERHDYRLVGVLVFAIWTAACGGAASPPSLPAASPRTEQAAPARSAPSEIAPDHLLRLAGTPDARPGAPERIEFFARELEGIDRNWKNVGFILEELVRIHLVRTKYPADDFHVGTSLQYFGDGRTLGELDVVVIRRADGKVVEVGQVKFSGNPARAIGEAKEQIDRFRRAVADGRTDRIKWSDTTAAAPPASAFTDETHHVTYGCRGSCAAGFDYELDIDRDEAEPIRDALLARSGEVSARR